MKQEVTYEQWSSIPDEQRIEFANSVYLKDGEKTQKMAPPTLGQMIQYLSGWGMVGIKKTLFDEGWTVDFPMYFVDKQGAELVDVLWEAVKKVLSQNH